MIDVKEFFAKIGIRALGILKMAVGLSVAASLPTCLGVGIYNLVEGKEERQAIYAEFQQTDAYQEAMAKKNDRLEYLKEHYTDEEYFAKEERYLNSSTYLDDIIYATDYRGILLQADDKIDLGYSLAVWGTVFSVLGNTMFYGLGCLVYEVILDYERTNILSDGFSNLVTGEFDAY